MIEGLLFLESTLGADARGVVREFFRRSKGEATGMPLPPTGWAQLNVTKSHRGAIRGLHAEGTDKLIGIVSGEGFGVWVDARPSSATFGEIVTSHLANGTQVYIPAGVLNGWQSLSSPAHYLYCFSREWSPDMGGVYVSPLDPTLGIDWPLAVDPSNLSHISAKDAAAPQWTAVRDSLLA